MANDGAKKIDGSNPAAPSASLADEQRLLVVRPAGQFTNEPTPIRSSTRPDNPQDPNAVIRHTNLQQAGRHETDPNLKENQGGQFDDELATFFRYRRLASQNRFSLVPVFAAIGKISVAVLVLCSIFVLCWNHAATFRVKFQSLGISYLGINFAENIPAWSKKSKLFRKQNTTELGQFHAREGRPAAPVSEAMKNPILSSVARGYWAKVERVVYPGCKTWQVTSDCSLKAWHMAYKGMRATLKPIANFDVQQIQKLPKTDQVLLLFAMSQAVIGQRADELFDQALKLAAFDKGVQRIIFDARIKNITREGQVIVLPRTMGQMSQIEARPADKLKWKTLEMIAKLNVKTLGSDRAFDDLLRKQMGELMRSDVGLLKADPVSFILIAKPALRLGFGKEIAFIGEAVTVQEDPKDFDPSLYRDISIFSIRANMLKGDIGKAQILAATLHKRVGVDATSAHLLASANLATQISSNAVRAIDLFKTAIRGQNHWQSHLGYFLSLTRSGKLSEAEKYLAKINQLSNPSNIIWFKMAKAEFALTKSQSSGSTRPSFFSAIASDLAPLYDKNKSWPTLSRLYSEALLKSGKTALAQKVQMAADVQADRVRYVASSEFLVSPFGPYALMP